LEIEEALELKQTENRITEDFEFSDLGSTPGTSAIFSF
jgi:hypothetical protein